MAKVTQIVVVLFLLGVMLAAAGCSDGTEARGVPEPGKSAPDFQLESLDGQTIKLSELRGRPVLLNFWATWCGPCRMEMPFLQQVAEDEEWKVRGLVILAVNLGEPASKAQAFVQEYGLSFTVLLDSDGGTGMLYNAQYIPTTYFIDNDGIIRDIKAGAFMNKSEIDRLLLNVFMNAES